MKVLIVASSQVIRDTAAKFFRTKIGITVFFANNRKEAIDRLNCLDGVAIVIISNKLHASGAESIEFGVEDFIVEKTHFSPLELNAYHVLLSALLFGKKAYIIDGYSEEIAVKTVEISFDNLPETKEAFIYLKDKNKLKNTLTMVNNNSFIEACSALLLYICFCKKKSIKFPKPFGLEELSQWDDVWSAIEADQLSLEVA